MSKLYVYVLKNENWRILVSLKFLKKNIQLFGMLIENMEMREKKRNFFFRVEEDLNTFFSRVVIFICIFYFIYNTIFNLFITIARVAFLGNLKKRTTIIVKNKKMIKISIYEIWCRLSEKEYLLVIAEILKICSLYWMNLI